MRLKKTFAAVLVFGAIACLPFVASAQECSCVCPAAAVPATSDAVTALPSADATSVETGPAASASQEEIASAAQPDAPLPSTVIFNEVFADPIGDDATAEFFELLNDGTVDASMSGWKIADAKDRTYAIVDGTVPAGGYRTFRTPLTGIPLVNDGGTLILLRPDGSEAGRVTYGATARSGWSWSRQPDGYWAWTEPTDGAANAAPRSAEVIGPADRSTSPSAATAATAVSPAVCRGTAPIDSVRVSELLPRPPKGEDEWIELHNTSDEPADLSGWRLDDAEGGSAPHELPCGTVLPPDGYAVFLKTVTRLALNDDLDEVRLLTPEMAVVDLVAYRGARLNESFALTGDGWLWTVTSTPGRNNIVPGPAEAAAPIVSPATADIIAVPTAGQTGQATTDGAVTGTVTLGTGVIGPHTFVLATDAGEAVFVKSADAEVRTGSFVTVVGTSRSYGIRTWLTAKTVLTDPKTVQIAYADMMLGELDDSSDGLPMSVSGIVESVGAVSFRLSDPDSDATVRIRLPHGSAPTGIARGATVHARGVVRWQGKSAELLLESPKQLTVARKPDSPPVAVASAATSAATDAAAPESGSLPQPLLPRVPNAAQKALWPSLLLMMSGAVAGTGFLFWRRKKIDEMEIVQE